MTQQPDRCREAAEYVIDRLKRGGADAAQCTAALIRTDETNVETGEFTLQRTLFDLSLSMKALVGGRKGTVALNRFDRETLDAAVEDCLAAAKVSEPDEAEGIAEYSSPRRFTCGNLAPDREKLFDAVEAFMADVAEKYPKIMLRTLAATCTEAEQVFLNSEGVDFTTEEGFYGFSSMYSAAEKGKSSSFGYYYTQTEDMERPLLDLGMQARLLAETERQIETRPLSGKHVGPVIFAPDCLQGFLQMALSSFAGDMALIEGTSPWREKLHQKVASDSLTVALAPLDSRIVCGERHTRDGYLSEDAPVITAGVLEGFTLSRYGAARTGHRRFPNSSFSPIVAPGKRSLEAMIGDIPKGLLIGRFSGGMPQANGDFSGVAKNSFLIENGKVTDAVSETMISGNLVDLLLRIPGVSSETVCDGMSVLPWLAADGVTMTGK
ncbi:TldD/PmbA family protein [Oscillospiraceae bacterium OttesenSCG-928-F05]|nr:TldD/PmbA family protein [Oscillospiraceae bacterium OttesenSCG-928-F05]